MSTWGLQYNRSWDPGPKLYSSSGRLKIGSEKSKIISKDIEVIQEPTEILAILFLREFMAYNGLKLLIQRHLKILKFTQFLSAIGFGQVWIPGITKKSKPL